MTSELSKTSRNVVTGRLTSARGEKISAVEGMTLSPRMRQLLDRTQDKTGEERRELIKAQFAKKNG
jgi:hypothetical protein